MRDAVFVVEGGSAQATPWAAGPWDPRLMHGGAPSALVAWAAEALEAPVPMRVARLTIDLLRPVPVGELAIEREVVRQGRKIQLCQVRLLSSGVEVTRGMVLKVRKEALDLPPGFAPPLDHPLPEALGPMETRPGAGNAFGDNFEMRRVHGGFGELGPGVAWFRQHRPLIAGEPLTPAMRAAAVADFSNGVSSVLPFDAWTFINGDLSVSLAREPQGEWILTNAESWIGPDGAGVAMTRLADIHGYFGTATQSLVVERR